MGSFVERANDYKGNQDARFRAMVNDAARVSPQTERLREFAKSFAIGEFKKAGLYDFLEEAVVYAKSHDGHHDARLELDAVGQVLLRKEDIVFNRPDETAAIAEVRWNFIPASMAPGYTYCQVNLYPSQRRIAVIGLQEIGSFSVGDPGIENAIVTAYFNPAVRPPIESHPENA